LRAVVLSAHGSYDVLGVQERPDPRPGPGQVRVDVRAAGVNFADHMARQGLYDDAPKPPCVLGYEVAGVVAQVGEGVLRPAVGDRVMAGSRFGGYAEQVVVGASDCVPMPDGLGFAHAAAIPVNYATAWAGLIGFGSLREGERVLVQAAAGGVGIAATQIARRHGAEVWGTSSPSKHERIRSIGVQHPLDYTRRGWHEGLPPFDLVMDAIGGDSLRRSYRMLGTGGRLVAFGAASVTSPEKRNLLRAGRSALPMLRGFNLIEQMSASKTVIGLNLLRLWDDRGTLEPWIGPLTALMADGTIDPVVAEEVPFERAGDAHRLLAERRNVGKVVLVP
jgi:NADPH:quinone reductase-like Zn-dependent oxidoreductase